MYMDKKKVLILHSDIPPDATPDELDVLDEANYLASGLIESGFDVSLLPFKLNLDALKTQLSEINPDAVFNLVETIEADGRLIGIAPLLFDHLKLPYYGCSAETIMLTSNKIFTKKVLETSNIPTASYICLDNIDKAVIKPDIKYIFKSVWEHASVGLEDNCVRNIISKKELYDYLKKCKNEGKPMFAEEYIDGREFNVAMIGSYEDFEILPVSEIEFIDYPDDKPKIIDYKAKWIEDTFEYDHTIRTFEPYEKEKILCGKLQEISNACWIAFELNGYARIDFRVDKNGNPFVLEINANPCITEVSGFTSSAKQAGYDLKEVLKKIMKIPNNHN